MKIVLGTIERDRLRKLYRYSSGRDHQLFQAVLLSSEGWSQSKIAKTLKLDVNTVSAYLSEYYNSRRLKSQKRLSLYKLKPNQETELIAYIEQNPNVIVRTVLEHIERRYQAVWTETAVRLFLKKHNFSCKSRLVFDREIVNKFGQKKFIYRSERGWFRNKITDSNSCVS